MSTQQPAPATGTPAPPSEHHPQERKPRGGSLLMILTLIVAICAVVLATIALTRHQSPPPRVEAAQPARGTTTAAMPSPADIDAAKQTACESWNAASKAMVNARRAFLTAPPNWDDPVNASALAQAQAGILVQVEFIRRHVPPATPSELADAIADYNDASIDLVALDGQHQSAAVANAAADQTGMLATKIRESCGMN